MKFSVAAVLAAATSVSAVTGSNVTYTTEVVTAYTTYCPAATEITHGTKTYTVTEPTTLTITDCPCTLTKPVITTSSVYCPTSTGSWSNSTVVQVPSGTATVPAGTSSEEAPTTVPTAGAARAAGLSGLAGLVGLAAFAL